MDNISAIILGVSLITVMFGVGLSLSTADFKRIFKQPKAVLLGLVNQLLILPLVAYLIIWMLGLEAEIAVGVMILAACPGGATSNIIAHLAKGDSALSVTLTGISSLITIVTIPFIIQFALVNFLAEGKQIDLNELQLIGQLLIVVIIPVSLGMFISAKRPAFAQRMDNTVRKFSTILLIIVTAGLIFKERQNVIPYFQQAGLASIFLNAITTSIGFFSAILFKLNNKQAISVSIESGIQNSAMAITIATITLGNTAFGIAPAIYTLVMYAAGFIIIFIGQSMSKKAMQSN